MNNLAAFMMNTLGSAAARTATDDTQAYSLTTTYDNNTYDFNSIILQNPQNHNEVIHTFTRGNNHSEDAAKNWCARRSTDKAATFGSVFTFFDPTDGTFQIQSPGIGYDNNGRIHGFADCHEDLDQPGFNHELRYFYSDDGLATISTPVVIPFPVTSMNTFQVYGRMIQMGNVLLITAFFYPDQDDITSSENWCLRSTDFGANWTWVFMGAFTGEFISEGEQLGITDLIGIFVFRAENNERFFMYKTEDAGLTFIQCGQFGFLVMTVAGPCRLHKFKADDGAEIAEMVFMDRGGSPKTVLAVYGRLDVGVIAGIGIWKQTVYTLASDATFILNYGDVCHLDNNMNAVGMYSRETNFPTDNEIIHFECPATQYGSVYSIIKPVTIYDPLALPQFIFTWRGLITNNANDWGTVSAANEVTLVKSISSANVGAGYNFSGTAGGIVLGDGIELDGTKRLTGTTPLNFNFMSYSTAGVTDINQTIYFTIKPGIVANPDAAYGIWGTSAASAANIGISIWWDDRSAQSRNNAIRIVISKSGVPFTLDFVNDNVITPNTYQQVCIEIDLSQASNDDKVKMWVNNVFQTTTVTTFTAAVANTPTFNPQIGGVGNNVFPFIGGIKDIIFQNAIDIASVRNYMINTLMTLEGL